MDFKIIHYNAGEDTISPALFVEVKRPGGSVRDVEEQGFGVAKSAINAHKLTGIYVLTVWGLKFRAWFVAEKCEHLDPLFGLAQLAKKESYLDMTSPIGVFELEKTIDLAKRDPPMRRAPVVPSQQAEMNEMFRAGTFHLGESSVAGGHTGGHDEGPVYPTMHPWGQPTQSTSFGTHESNKQPWVPGEEGRAPEGMPADEEDDEDSDAGDAGGKGKAKRKAKERREVRVRLIPHKARKDEYVFEGVDGSDRITLLTEWKRKQCDGRTVFECRGRRTIYWCKRLPER
ncbi:hypothetical protein ACHAPT_012543 [Fusarium lateritium]